MLESNYKNYGRIRRKAYNLNNPVCNAGLGIDQSSSNSVLGVELLRSSGRGRFSSYPELRFACTGLSGFKTCGLAFEKRSYKVCSFEHDFNLLK